MHCDKQTILSSTGLMNAVFVHYSTFSIGNRLPENAPVTSVTRVLQFKGTFPTTVCPTTPTELPQNVITRTKCSY